MAALGDHVGLERHWIYSVDGDPRGDPGDAGSPGAVDVSPDHGAVEIPFCLGGVCPSFASSLVDWREVEHFVRAVRDICGISKVCLFGWRLCQRFGKIAWNKYGVL